MVAYINFQVQAVQSVIQQSVQYLFLFVFLKKRENCYLILCFSYLQAKIGEDFR